MKERRTEDLIKKGTISTSDDFTDKLMLKLEAQQEITKTQVWSFKKVYGILIIVLSLTSFLIFRFLNHLLASININISKVSIFIMIAIPFFICLNYLVRLNTNALLLKPKA
ncbi:hypothetical protein [Aquimarina sp. 2201CG5-10]|uniref:hypothetical protein n=1 Tax=Aquimarina callyspongiae TaxID=3098150 RepID=UPI002AB37FF3|nr:hypothetical protein [Aquimarina sp. 2201CG5-10]MDY8137681.1 hypothetical protein [Aquimarina sp. 2201CG5-10]